VTVLLGGAAPVPATIQATADPYCVEAHEGEPLLSQTAKGSL